MSAIYLQSGNRLSFSIIGLEFSDVCEIVDCVGMFPCTALEIVIKMCFSNFTFSYMSLAYVYRV